MAHATENKAADTKLAGLTWELADFQTQLDNQRNTTASAIAAAKAANTDLETVR